MTRANLAAFRSKAVALIDTLHLHPADVVAVTLRLAVEYAAKTATTADTLHNQLDDLRAALAVEGAGDAGQ